MVLSGNVYAKCVESAISMSTNFYISSNLMVWLDEEHWMNFLCNWSTPPIDWWIQISIVMPPLLAG